MKDDVLDEYVGEVVWFSKELGYGFVAWTKNGKPQTDIFCHFSDIDMEGFRQLKGGQRVQFNIGSNNAGRPKAVNVKIIE